MGLGLLGRTENVYQTECQHGHNKNAGISKMNLVWPGHQSYSDLIYQHEDIHLNINKNWQKGGIGIGSDGHHQHTGNPSMNTPINGWPAGHMAPIFNM